MLIATAATLAAAVAIAYRLDRRYGRWEARWLAEVSPLTGPRDRVARVRTGYRNRREDVSDLVWIISAVMDEVAAARSSTR